MTNDELSYNLGDTVDRDHGSKSEWIHERCFADDLVSRWAKSIVDSEKKFFSK